MRRIHLTKDGSPTLYASQFDAHYHSLHGAITESLHVFIEMGLRKKEAAMHDIRILEMGLGTGMNLWLTWQNAQPHTLIRYDAIEAFPLLKEEYKELLISNNERESDFFQFIHESEWEIAHNYNSSFTFAKYLVKLEDFTATHAYDIVFYDAFAPTAQPELWTEAVFQKLYGLMAHQGILVTYCAKGSVRRAMQAVGFQVERLPGPPGKREMLRATKS